MENSAHSFRIINVGMFQHLIVTKEDFLALKTLSKHFPIA